MTALVMTVTGLGLAQQSSSYDLDGDGVPNYADQCPKQPGPRSNSGCPVQEPGDTNPWLDFNGGWEFNQLTARSKVIKPGHPKYYQLLQKFKARKQMLDSQNRQNLKNFNGYSMRGGLNRYQVRKELNTSGLSYLGKKGGNDVYVMQGSIILVIVPPVGPPTFIYLPFFPPLPWFFSLLIIIF